MRENITILIPAYEPTSTLIQYVHDLSQHFEHIVVVDDGSGKNYLNIFNSIESLCHVIHYPDNQGKGYALKTGYQYIKENYINTQGVVTVDCDGQHHLNDVINISEMIENHPHSLILGTRDFSQKNVPIKSQFGNRFSSLLFFILYGKWLNDTQTGLRGFDMSLIDEMIMIQGNRFEYESQVLIDCVEKNIPIKTKSIQTIYEDNNSGTHFQPLRDSLLISKVLLGRFSKFFSSSIMSSIIDIGFAWLFLDLLKICIFDDFLRIICATILARIISMLFNYTVNKKYVFKNKSSHKTFIRYLILSIIIMLLSGSFVYIAANFIGINEKIAKPIVDSLLFLLSYQLQKKWVFKEVSNHEK